MIVGSGDIASVLHDRDDRLFFASGVSNSQETRESEFEREKALLAEQDPSMHIVYFSTLSVFYGMSRYVDHKREMEDIIQTRPHNTIVRIGNITWGNNPHTLINYLKAHPEAEIRDEYRYVIDEEEFNHWVDMIPYRNCEMNITGRRMKVQEIYDEIQAGKL